MKKITKNLLSLAILSLVFAPMLIQAAGTPSLTNLGADDSGTVGSSVNLGNQSPLTTATNLINTLLTFLGLIAVCIILYGGFKWMTAMGSEEKTGEAKKLILSGAIGIVIILSAWGISKYVLGQAIALNTAAGK